MPLCRVADGVQGSDYSMFNMAGETKGEIKSRNYGLGVMENSLENPAKDVHACYF